MQGVGEDNVVRFPAKSRGSEVKSFYRALKVNDDCYFPWRSVWKARAPPRVAFFTWSAAPGKILTLDNLRRIVVVVID